jgi:hypothetical protein
MPAVSDVPYARYPLGLPAGSVRAVLALMIAGLFWLLLVLPEGNEVPVPLFLYFLLGLIMLFFGSHGHTIGRPFGGHPLHLPRGSIRGLILLGTAAVLAWLYYAHPDRLQSRLKPEPSQLGQWPILLLTAVGAFTAGYVIRLGPWRNTAMYQDVLATISLLAMLGLAAETILVVFINPSLFQGIDLSTWEVVLTAVVAFYFGARS